MFISYNEACTMKCSTLEQDLNLCEEAGFDYIEIRLDMLKDYLRNHKLEDIATFFATSHIKPHAINAVYLYPEFLGSQDNEERQTALMNEFKLACEAGFMIGSHYIIIVPPLQKDINGGPYQGKYEDTKRECIRILRELSKLAEPYHMNLCFELVGFDRSSVRSIMDADDIVRGVDRDNVGFVFDSYNIYLNGGCNDFSEISRVQTKKIFAVHLMSGDDVPEHERGQDKRCFCGRGVVDTDAFLQQLKKCDYQGMVSVETFRPEYWSEKPEVVISRAYETTHEALKRNLCL